MHASFKKITCLALCFFASIFLLQFWLLQLTYQQVTEYQWLALYSTRLTNGIEELSTLLKEVEKDHRAVITAAKTLSGKNNEAIAITGTPPPPTTSAYTINQIEEKLKTLLNLNSKQTLAAPNLQPLEKLIHQKLQFYQTSSTLLANREISTALAIENAPENVSLTAKIRTEMVAIIHKAQNLPALHSQTHTAKIQSFFYSLICLDFLFVLGSIALFLTFRHRQSQIIKITTERDIEKIKFASLFEELPDAYVLLNSQKILNCNQAALALFDCDTKDKLVGKNISILWPEHGQTSVGKKIKNVLQNTSQTKPCHIQTDCQNFSGHFFTAEITISALSNKESPEYLTKWRDISDETLCKLNRQTQEQRQELAATLTEEGVFDWNCKTGKVYYSKKFLAMLQLESLTDPNDINIFINRLHPDDKALVLQSFDLHFTTQQSHNLTCRLQCSDGTYLLVRLRGQAQWDNTGKAIRLVCIVKDISETTEITSKNQAILAEISQTLRAKLTAIDGALSLMTNDKNDEISFKLQQLISMAQKNSKELMLAAENLLKNEFS